MKNSEVIPAVVSLAEDATASEERSFRILHVSDIHKGLKFQKARWSNLIDVTRGLRPDLIVLTGDLVNTPWRWMTGRTRELLGELSEALGRAEGTPCPLWMIAGNHDTRLSGVLPVAWFVSIVGVCAAVSAGAWWLARTAQQPSVALAWEVFASLVAIVGVVALGLRFAMTRNIAEAVGAPYFLQRATLSNCQQVGIVPLDSASHDVSWARGRIRDLALSRVGRQMEEAEKELHAGARRPVWIALVHHHPLPLPYDSPRERMMVMDNAGALLSELTRRRIRLVLHGHKHHQHFARIVINPSRTPYAELAVLSAGTPTEGRSAGAFWHGFNVIDIDSESRIRITPYEAPPENGTFAPGDPFDLVPNEQHDRDQHRENVARLPLSCRRFLCSAHINVYGDARFVREFSGVKTREKSIERMDAPFVAEAKSGLVEAYIARSLSSHGPTVTARPTRISAHRIQADILFTNGLQGSEPPIEFATEFHANNGFALNKWQFKCMYPERDDEQEQLRCRVPPDLATEELILHVRYPAELGLPTRLNLRVGLGPEGSVVWRSLSSDAIIKIASQREVQVRIAHPLPSALYEISWNLNANRYGEGDPTRERGIARSLSLRSRLALLTPKRLPSRLAELLERVELNARDVLGAGAEKQLRAYEISLFAFDDGTASLRYLAGSHPADDPRRMGVYPFGLGTVGRAFKSSEVAAFRRPSAHPDEQPWGYVLPNGEPVLRMNQVPEVAILAFPLAPPEASDWPYAVLQISTDDPAGVLKTTNTASDVSLETFAAAAAALTPDLEDILRRSPEIE